MAQKRFIVGIGTGIDLHGENVTKAACRAVNDAVSRSCLCGLVEIMDLQDLGDVSVEILIASPRPHEVDLEQVKAAVPIGQKTARTVEGELVTEGICVPAFAPTCNQVVVVNASVTVITGPGWSPLDRQGRKEKRKECALLGSGMLTYGRSLTKEVRCGSHLTHWGSKNLSIQRNFYGGGMDNGRQ